jgi:hypothetical protein
MDEKETKIPLFDIKCPFDGFYKYALGIPSVMRDFLKGANKRGDIPNWYADVCLEQLTSINTNFISKKLSQTHADLLFRMPDPERDRPCYFHNECSGEIKAEDRARLYRYLGKIVEYDQRYYQRKGVEKLKFPPVGQLFTYIGPKCPRAEKMEKWINESQGVIAGSNDCVRMLCLYRYDDEVYLKDKEAGIPLILLKHAYDRTFFEFFKANPTIARKVGEWEHAEVAECLLGSLVKTEVECTEFLKMFIFVPDKIEKYMLGPVNPIIDEVRQEGRQEGRKEARKTVVEEIERRMRLCGLDDSLIRSILPTMPAFS